MNKEHFINEKSLMKADDIKDQIKGYLKQIENEKVKEGLMSNVLKNKIDLLHYENILNNDKDSNMCLIIDSQKQELILKCLYTGYFMNTAKYYSENMFVTLRDKTICRIHPTSVIINDMKTAKSYEYLIYNEIIEGSKLFYKCCSLIKSDWVQKYNNYFNR